MDAPEDSEDNATRCLNVVPRDALEGTMSPLSNTLIESA